MIYIIGDLHINSAKTYSNIMVDKLINYFDNCSWNNKENSLILLGDVLDLTNNSGETYKNLIRVLNKSRLNKLDIIPGNHDQYKNQDYTDYKKSSALDFINELNYPNIRVINKPEVINIENMNFLFLPYINHAFNKYKANDIKNINKTDYIVGHIDLNEYCNYDLDDIFNNIPLVKRMILGHIHTPINLIYKNIPVNFIGSFYPTRANEEEINDFMLADYQGTNVEKTKRSFVSIDKDHKIKFNDVPFSINYHNIKWDYDKIRKLKNDNSNILDIYRIDIRDISLKDNSFNTLLEDINYIRKDLNDYVSKDNNILIQLTAEDGNRYIEQLNNLSNVILSSDSKKSLSEYFNNFINEDNINIDEDVKNKIFKELKEN